MVPVTAEHMIDCALNSDETVLAIHDNNGKAQAAASFHVNAEELHISYFGSRIRGLGTQLMTHLITLANGRVISVLSERSSVPFYKKFGFEVIASHSHTFDMRRS